MITLQPPEWSEDYACVFGGHRVPRQSLLGFLDGHPVCADHARQIVAAADGAYGGDIEGRIADAYKQNRKRWREAEREKAAEVLRGKRAPGFVYYLKIDNMIKIGYTVDIRKRMAAYPPNAELLAAHPGTVELEKAMHHQFCAYLRRGREWFATSEELLDHIASVREKFGDVSNLGYRYRESG